LSQNDIIYYTDWHKFKDYEVCEIAAKNGWLDLLKWAIEKNCRMNGMTFAYATIYGHFELLKWMRIQNGSQYDRCIYEFASKYGQLEILKWIVISQHDRVNN
jgi:hypothetical protein